MQQPTHAHTQHLNQYEVNNVLPTTTTLKPSSGSTFVTETGVHNITWETTPLTASG